jgi:tryptophan synthase alpha chain
MVNPIEDVFSDETAIKLMTHVVAGYPDLKTSEDLILTMAKNGADLIEIQIPFSDPLADGPTITTANQIALDNGVTPHQCFQLVERVRQKLDVPLLAMTYANIASNMGINYFIQKCSSCGINGLIIPDLPFNLESQDYLSAAIRHDCLPIPVVSPGMKKERLTDILELSAGFVYATLRIGTTGAKNRINEQGFEFLNLLRKSTSLPIVAGFGISSPEMIHQLEGIADAAVVGSHIINILNTHGLEAIGPFIRDCKIL